MVSIVMSAADADASAARLGEFLAADGIILEQSRAAEAFAHALGYAGWSTLKTLLSTAKPAIVAVLSATQAKEAVGRLRAFLAANGIGLKQTNAYEALACALGYANWNTLQARLKPAGAPVTVKFWGVRGHMPCPSPNHVVYGGNTSCVEVAWGDTGLILDAGTGMRFCGNAYVRRANRSAVVLLSHCHWYHIIGLSFFAPVQTEGWRVRVLAGHLADRGGLCAVFANAYAPGPTYPHPLKNWYANQTTSFEDFRAGEVLTGLAPGAVVRTAPLNHHTDGATGYRIEVQGRVICYVTDTEHVPGKLDTNVLALIEDADLVIYNATYTDEEFPSRIGWGHSTWQEGLRLCKAANAKRLALFHHDPSHDDDFMARLETEARQVWSGVVAARDNMTLAVG